MSDLNFRHNESIQELLKCVEQLRGPQGCPWDKEQTHQSLIPYALDEAYELVEVIESLPLQDDKLKDELGDVLFQVLIHSQIAQEENRFNFQQVVENLREKLIRRHPHVFDFQGSISKEDVLKNWEKIKSQESGTSESPTALKKIFKTPRFFSALKKAEAIGRKTETFKFDWENEHQVFEKVLEETQELKEALEGSDPHHIEEEIGDLFFVLAQLCRKLKIDPEKAAQKSNQKFITRFEKMLELAEPGTSAKSQDDLHLTLKQFELLPTETKEALWKKIKFTEKEPS